MANLVAKYAMKKALGKEMEKYRGKSASGPYVSRALVLYPRCVIHTNDSAGSFLRRNPTPKEAWQDEEG